MLKFEDVSFAYRARTDVLRSFSWNVPAGRTVLLGPNGAGKTTLLSLGSNALNPVSGRVCLGELDPARRRDRAAYRAAVGWMPQVIKPLPGLTCREQVAYAGWLKGASRADAWNHALDALSKVALADHADRSVSQLSGGQLRRVGLAQTLVHNAQVLLLDEPTAGLDPAQRGKLRETLALMPSDTTLVVSTHQVDDLGDLFDRVVVVDRGRMVFDGDVTSFMDLAPDGSIRRAEAAYSQLISGES